MGAIPLDKAYLTAIWLETLFYGINLLLFSAYLWIVRYKKRSRNVSRVILPTAIFMFCFSTIHVSLGFQRLIEGFINLRDQPGGPGAFFSDVSIPANVAKVCIHTINSLLGDSIVVWRCYHVWGRNWWILVFPILLIIASAVAGFGQTVVFAQAKDSHSAFVHTLQVWNGSVFGLSLTTNVVVTSLIAFRIWHLGRQLNFGASFRYRRVLTLIVESGLIYSSALVIEITLYFLHSNAFYIIYDPIAQLTAIVPTMIIVMACLGLTSNDLNEMQTKMTIESGGPQFAAKPRPTTTTAVSSMQFGATSGHRAFVDIQGGDDFGLSSTGEGTRTSEKPQADIYTVEAG